jgi:hypothetical protein
MHLSCVCTSTGCPFAFHDPLSSSRYCSEPTTHMSWSMSLSSSPVVTTTSFSDDGCDLGAAVLSMAWLCPTELQAGSSAVCPCMCDAFVSPAVCRATAYSQVFKSSCPWSYTINDGGGRRHLPARVASAVYRRN